MRRLVASTHHALITGPFLQGIRSHSTSRCFATFSCWRSNVSKQRAKSVERTMTTSKAKTTVKKSEKQPSLHPLKISTVVNLLNNTRWFYRGSHWYFRLTSVCLFRTLFNLSPFFRSFLFLRHGRSLHIFTLYTIKRIKTRYDVYSFFLIGRIIMVYVRS